MSAWTRRALLYERRTDPGGAATQAYHRAGYVWSFDQKLDRERCFRWRARPSDSFERGLPVDEQDRRKMLRHEIEASAAPEKGWRHFRFCECRSCSPAEHLSRLQKRLRLILSVPLLCVFFVGLLLMRPTMPEPGGLVGLVMVLVSGAIFALWQRSERRTWRRERLKRLQGPPPMATSASSESTGPKHPSAPLGRQTAERPAPAAAHGIRPSRPDALGAQPSATTVGVPSAEPEPPEPPDAPDAPLAP
jgi:hypothetical protein